MKEYFGYKIENDFEEYQGPVPYDRFLQRAIDFGVENEVFERFGNRKETNVNKVVREYYKEYKKLFNVN